MAVLGASFKEASCKDSYIRPKRKVRSGRLNCELSFSKS